MGRKTEYTAEADTTAIKAVLAAAPGLTRAKADRLLKSGEVRVNGVRVKTNVAVAVGDSVCVFVPDSLTVDVKTVYEDDNIIVFDKPKHVVFDAIPQIVGKELFAVHRLDANTTGIIAFAKSEKVQSELELAFKERRARKKYMAVVYPAPKKQSDTLTAYTSFGGDVAAVSPEMRQGYKTMITEYETVKRIGEAAILLVSPHTGRTHQIRAHLAFIGCPIVGDPKYGTDDKLPGAPDTQMLCAVELGFTGMTGKLEYLNGKKFSVCPDFDLAFLSEKTGK